MSRRLLPIGIQSFRTIREENCYYVDKTALIHELVTRGRYYFLSRPRRFGKSLLLDTMRELFAGNEPLFRGLDIHRRWNWDDTYPVVRLSFDGNYSASSNLEEHILDQLGRVEEDAGVRSPARARVGASRFQNLLYRLHRTTGRQVVVLVDEYDKPILDVLGNPDLAKANRDRLQGLYGVIKGSAEHVRFVFVTGISMFSKVSLFSGLNNLWDISLDPRYATLCGYTDEDLDTVFGPELSGLDRDEIRRWYNGYHWRGERKMYNPFDILLLLAKHEFQPYWYTTGSPSFLFPVMMDRRVSTLELADSVSDASLLTTFDVDDIRLEALLFQTGYLTIASEERIGPQTLFTLDYPNLEVRYSLNNSLLQHVGGRSAVVSSDGRALCRMLAERDFDGFAARMRSFFAGVPYQWQSRPELARYEAWYAGMLYACFQTIGMDVRVEDASHRGRADMVLLHGGQVFVLEFKMAEDDGDAEAAMVRAMAQIRERGYAEKYRGRGEPIHLLAVVFGRQERNLIGVRAERG